MFLNLPNVFRSFGVVVNLLRAPFHVVHVELFLLGVEDGLNTHVVGLVGVQCLAGDDVAEV